MANVILYNLGNSELEPKYKENEKYSKFDDFRNFTQTILKRIENGGVKKEKNALVFDPALVKTIPFKGKDIEREITEIRFPIFEAFRGSIKNSVEKIYIFATRQKAVNKSDTDILAKIMKYFIQEEYGTKTEIKIEIIEGTPSDFNQMGEFYDRFFDNNKEELEAYNKIYAQVSSGTSAMIFSFSEKLALFDAEIYYIPRGKEEAEKINYFNKRLIEHLIETIKNCIENLNYKNALEITEKSPLKTKNTAKNLIKSALYLVNFNFKDSLNELKNIGEEDREINGIKNSVSDICYESNKMKCWCLIEEMIDIHLKNENFLASLILLIGLSNNMREFVFKELTGTDDIKEFVENNPKIKESLNKKDLDFQNKYATKPVLSIIISLLGKEKYTNYIEYDKDIENLSEIRNKTPFAHGTKGVNTGDVEKIKSSAQKINDVFKELGIKNDKKLFSIINNKIIHSLKN